MYFLTIFVQCVLYSTIYVSLQGWKSVSRPPSLPPLTPPTHSVPGEVRVRGERGEWVIPLPSRNIRGIFIPKLYPPRDRILSHKMKCNK